MYTVLRAASRILQDYLLGRFQADPALGPLFVVGGTMQISLLSPEQMPRANLQGLSVWLYRVVRDEERLNDPLIRVGPKLVQPPPLPMRAHYLMTPITDVQTRSGVETEQAILGKVLQSLNDRPSLRGTDLRDDLAGTDAELHVRLEPLGLQEIYEVWDALDASYRLSVSYEVSVLNIGPALGQSQASLVLVAEPEYAQIVGTT
jgi:hypothetical protein